MDSENDSLYAASPWRGPAILLVDLDAFFASVEQLDHPEWRGKPVIVGGDADKRGVVSTCSYEARAFGVRSAMPSSTAARLCPEAIWTHGHFDRYREMSKATMDIIRDETPLVEQVSIDEAFADISLTRVNTVHPVVVARRVQRRVAELGITCSIGLATTKSVAKIASEMDKPHGLTIVYPGTEQAFLADLPVNVVSGIGKAAAESLHALGIKTLAQLGACDPQDLRKVFGARTEMMIARARGEDDSPVTVGREMKSVSHELTFATDLVSREEIDAALTKLLTRVGRRMRMYGVAGNTLCVKVRFADRSVHTAQMRLKAPSDDDIALRPLLMTLFDKVWAPGQKVRLLGVAVSGFGETESAQTSLFDEEGSVQDQATRRTLLDTFDALKDKFGEDAVVFGSELVDADNTTGSTPKDPTDYR